MEPCLRETGEGVVLKVQVQTRAARNEVVGLHGDALKTRITAAPVGGAANRHLLKLLAKRLKIPQSQMEIKSGAASRTKSIAIQGISVDEVKQRLEI